MMTTSLEETKKLAQEYALSLKAGDVVFLEGDLGAGKTTFVQGCAEALGYLGPVRSPTFSLLNTYPLQGESIKEIIHMDLYRLKDDAELKMLGIHEILANPHAVFFIEWPSEAIEQFLPNGYHKIMFRFVNESTREINI